MTFSRTTLAKSAAALALVAGFALGGGIAAANPDRILNLQETQDLIAQKDNIFYLAPDKTLDSVLAEAGSTPVFVMFHAEWCPYCKALRPILAEEFAKRFPDGNARLVIVDVDVHKQFKRPVPQVIPYHNGKASTETLNGLPGVTTIDGKKTLSVSDARAAVISFLEQGLKRDARPESRIITPSPRP